MIKVPAKNASAYDYAFLNINFHVFNGLDEMNFFAFDILGRTFSCILIRLLNKYKKAKMCGCG
jgi:hypothetical protein